MLTQNLDYNQINAANQLNANNTIQKNIDYNQINAANQLNANNTIQNCYTDRHKYDHNKYTIPR